jgi:hypothetical protein
MIRHIQSSALKYALPLLLDAVAATAVAAADRVNRPFTEESKIDNVQAGWRRRPKGFRDQ